jgi:hypothetical protein
MKLSPVARALLGVIAAAALIVGAIPARAASLAWEDPKGDATDHGNLQNSAFDVTSVKLSNSGGFVKFELTVPGMVTGRPTAATGYTFRLKFKYADSEFRLQVNENLLGQTSVNLGLVGTTTTVYPCDKCEGKIDREKKTASFSAPIASLEAGFKSAGKPPLAGKEWTDLIAVGMRQAALPVPPGSTPSDGVRWENDPAPAPEGTTLAF